MESRAREVRAAPSIGVDRAARKSATGGIFVRRPVAFTKIAAAFTELQRRRAIFAPSENQGPRRADARSTRPGTIANRDDGSVSGGVERPSERRPDERE